MPEPKGTNKPAVAGKSVHEVMSRWRAQARLKPVATANGSEPLVDDGLLSRVNRLREELQERRIAELALGQTETEFELQRAETEARKFEAEAKAMEGKSRIQELREKLSGGESGGAGVTVIALLTMMEQLQGQLFQAKQEQPGDKMYEVLREQLTEIRQEIKERTAQKAEDPIEAMARQVATLLQIKQLFAELTPEEKHSPYARDAEADLSTTLKMQELDLQHQTRKLELEMQQERWKNEMRIKEREIEAEESRSRTLGQGIGTLAESFRPVIQELATIATARRTVPQPVAAAAYSIPSIEEESANPEPSSLMLKCSNPECGNDISVKYGSVEVMCQKCEGRFNVDWNSN